MVAVAIHIADSILDSQTKSRPKAAFCLRNSTDQATDSWLPVRRV
jgi:hypothetical protein